MTRGKLHWIETPVKQRVLCILRQLRTFFYKLLASLKTCGFQHKQCFALILLALATATNVTAQTACRQALALGLDVSGSVDESEYRIQLNGLASALTSDAVRAVLLAQGSAPVSVAVYEWSGPTDQRTIVAWTAITDELALLRTAAILQRARRQPASLTTAIGPAMTYGFDLLEQRRACWTRTLDLSGDGPANTGPRPQDIPVAELPSGVTVNGLVIGSGDQRGDDQRQADIKELSAYYTANVIRGPGAFVEAALGFEDYAATMERKLLRELSSLAIGDAGQ